MSKENIDLENQNLENEKVDVENLTAEELKQKAEEIEAENKILKKDSVSEIDEKEKELRHNYRIRLQKAQEKNEALKGNQKETTFQEKQENEVKQNPEDIVENLLVLKENGFDKDSDEVKTLQKFVDAGMFKNFKEAMQSAGVQAELAEIEKARNAKEVLDENDEVNGLVSKDIVSRFKTQNEVPEDQDDINDLAKNNIEEMGL